jgi:hypothetical protein
MSALKFLLGTRCEDSVGFMSRRIRLVPYSGRKAGNK